MVTCFWNNFFSSNLSASKTRTLILNFSKVRRFYKLIFSAIWCFHSQLIPSSKLANLFAESKRTCGNETRNTRHKKRQKHFDMTAGLIFPSFVWIREKCENAKIKTQKRVRICSRDSLKAECNSENSSVNVEIAWIRERSYERVSCLGSNLNVSLHSSVGTFPFFVMSSKRYVVKSVVEVTVGTCVRPQLAGTSADCAQEVFIDLECRRDSMHSGQV